MATVPAGVDEVAHYIQIALTPVFLLTGVASLLNVLSTRLGRVADHVDALSDRLASADKREARRLGSRLAYLERRTKILDLAVILTTFAGMLTSIAALLLFIDVLRQNAGASLFIAFGLALVCTVGGLIGFLMEMLLASRGIRTEASKSSDEAELAEAPHEAASDGGSGESGAAA